VLFVNCMFFLRAIHGLYVQQIVTNVNCTIKNKHVVGNMINGRGITVIMIIIMPNLLPKRYVGA